jgi:hypothetical protein
MTASSEFHSCDSASEHTEKTNVSFSTIVIHEHAMILGDGPASSGGPLLEIDWKEQAESTVRLDDYEAMRDPRRTKQELLMPGTIRTSLMLESGYTMRDIQETTSKRSPKKSSMKGSIRKRLSTLVKSR